MAEDMEQRPQTQNESRDDGRPADAPELEVQQHNDEMLRAVTSIDQQVEQIVSWKQRLSEQMDLLRRDGLKVLQWQKRLAEERSHLKAEADRLASDRADLESQRAAMAEEQRLASVELETRRNELESHRADLDARKEQLEAEQRRLNEREKSISDRQESLRKEQADLTARSDQLAADQQKLDDRRRELDRMQEELDSAKARFAAEKQVAATELAEGEAALKARRDVLQQRENELAARLVQLGADKGHLEGFIVVAEADIAQSRARLKELEAQRAELESHRSELEEKRAALEKKNAAVAAQLASAQERIEELEIRNRSLAQENTALASDDEDARRAKADLERQAMAAASRADELEKRAAELETRRQELIEEHKQAQTRIAELEKRCADLEQSLEAARSAENHAPEPTFRVEPENSDSFDNVFSAAETAPSAKRETEPEPRPAEESEEPAAATIADEDHTAIPDRTQWRAEDQARLHPRQEDLVQCQQLQRAIPEPEPEPVVPHTVHRSPVATAVNVIIFAAAVLGLTFGIVYRFFPATYRCEAVVQLVPPADLKPEQVGDWLNRQVEAIPRDGELLKSAWARLQSRAKYDAPEKWLAALPREMELKPEPTSRKLAVRVLGNDPEYVASAANAIADAYADRASRLNRQSNPQGQGKPATVAIHASVPKIPVTDHRMRVALTASASVLFLSLLAMMLIRRKMMRTAQTFDQLPG